jgi:predicted nucleic acid-binding protein
MTYLVDGNILSGPTKPAPDPKVVEWLIANEGDFVVDSIILGELLVGILMLPAGRKRARLEQWLEALVQTIDCVPWDAAVSRRWARLVVDLRKRRHKLPLLDGMIAAMALERGLTIVTRNPAIFEKLG